MSEVFLSKEDVAILTGHMTAISLNKLEALGLSAAPEIKREVA